MHKYIERIINVGVDDNCFQVVSGLLGKRDDDYQFGHHQLVQETVMHRESYAKLYENKENYDAILSALFPYFSGLTPFEKWMRFLEMRQLIASAYDRVCIDLTRNGFP